MNVMRRVYECISFDTATATCAQAAWVERAMFPELSTGDAMQLLGAALGLFVVCWGWRMLERQTGPRG